MSSFVSRFGWAGMNALSYIRTPALISSAVAALLTGVLYVKQNELIYPRNLPSGARTNVPTPADFDYHDYEDLRIKSADGETLGAYLIKPRDPTRSTDLLILMLHGNAGNVGHRVPIGIKLQDDLDCHVLMLEYRGYGLSSGTPDERGLSLDGQAALDYIRHRDDLRHFKLVVYGQSLGGAVAIPLVARNAGHGRIAGLILENTFTSMRSLIPSVFPAGRLIARLCHQLWPSDAVLPNITDVPILFLSGLKDEIIPPEQMRELYRICRSERKVWRPLPNGTHNESILQPRYFDYIAEFVKDEVMSPGKAATR